MSCKPISDKRLQELHAEHGYDFPPQTETLDKLYLEWSNFTGAKTARELQLEAQLEDRDMLYEAGITAARNEITELQAQLAEIKYIDGRRSSGLSTESQINFNRGWNRLHSILQAILREKDHE